ncbi:copper resistance D family protein [Mycolicibacterium chubuense]|uniref:copper resistance D family protein n=1 Tax=Mycolicibacterium chubuense TaxID=1800 RepID=UPI00059F8F97|nr:CopD family protein [Mycolicibacterium chubuense]
MTTRRAVAGALLVTAAACLAAWALAYPVGALSAALVRAVADGAAVVTLGLVIVPALDGSRYRAELRRRATVPAVAASAVWVVSELVRVVFGTAEAAGVGAGRVAVRTVWEFVVYTAPGRAGLITVAAAAGVCAVVSLAPRSDSAGVAAAGLAGIGIVSHPLTGHLSDSGVGGIAIAVHMLAAALWCGVLAALVLTVDHRGQWARVLPRFSALSLLCVAALLAGGVVAGLVIMDSPAQLYSNGWGRVLSAKIALTVALTVLAWRNRTLWLPAAQGHRATAEVSRSRAYTELALMATALALAASLAVTS